MPSEITDLRYIPVSYKQEFPKAGPDAFFRYQFWSGTVGDLRPAQKRLKELRDNPDWVGMLPADISEKDQVSWWSPTNPHTHNWIRGEFSGSMVNHYISHLMYKK